MAATVQVILRLLATGFNVGATYLMFTCKQHVEIAGFSLDASWKYSSAFVFFAYANAVGCGLSALSIPTVLLCCKPHRGGNYFYMVVHDSVVGILLMAAGAAATAVGFIGKYGNSHTGWTKICDNFGKFCNRVTLAIGCCYAAVLMYLILTILSAHKSNRKSI